MTMNDDCDRSQWQPRYGWSNRETKKKKINDDLQKPRRRCVEIILMVLNFIEVASRCHLWYHRSRPIYTHAHFTHNCMCVWLDVARTKNKKQLEWRIACLYTSNRIIFIPTACHGQRKKKKKQKDNPLTRVTECHWDLANGDVIIHLQQQQAEEWYIDAWILILIFIYIIPICSVMFVA